MGIEELTSLTSKDRIMIYLTDFINMDDRYELPAGLTQELISYGTGIQRKHLSQYLKDLLEENLVTERKAHIQGMRQRMNGYYLTAAGYTRAKDLKSRIENAVVPVSIDGRVTLRRVSEIDDMTSANISICDVVREAIREGALNMASLEDLERRKREAIEEEEQATDTYRRALQTTWRDGKVTATERFLVEELRKHLKVTEEQHRALEEEIVKKLAMDHMEFRRIYKTVLEVALADRMISGPEEAILDGLRRVMRLTRQEHDELVSEVMLSVIGPQGPEKDLQKEAMRLVREQTS